MSSCSICRCRTRTASRRWSGRTRKRPVFLSWCLPALTTKGSRFELSAKAPRIIWSKGPVTGQLLVRAMRYATERKRAVEALQRSEEYFRSLIENALDIITVLDIDGTVRYGSPSFERVLGLSAGRADAGEPFQADSS